MQVYIHPGKFIFRSICCHDLQAETTQEDEDLSLVGCDGLSFCIHICASTDFESVGKVHVAAIDASFVGSNSLTKRGTPAAMFG